MNIEEIKSIAEFLGAKVEVGYQSPTKTDYTVSGDVVLKWRNHPHLVLGGVKERMMLQMCRFDTSWDWLKLAIDKILAIVNQADVHLAEELNRAELRILDLSILCELDGVYPAVVEFVQFYKMYCDGE